MHDLTALHGEHIDVQVVDMHSVYGNEVGTRDAQAVQPCDGADAVLSATLLHLLARFLQMRLDRQIELPRVNDDFLPARVAYGIGSVRRQRERELRLVFPRVARGEARLQVAAGVGGVRRRKVEHRQADEGADAALPIGARGGIGKKILVGAARDAAQRRPDRLPSRDHAFRRR